MVKPSASLPTLEIGGYFVFWTTAVFYSVYQVKGASNVLEGLEDHYNDLSESWLIKGRKKDVSDYEWETFKQLLFSLAPWLIIHMLVSECLRLKSTYIKFLPHFQLTITMFYILYNFNLNIFIVIVSQPIIFKVFSKFKSKSVIWICEVSCLFVLQYYKDNGWQSTLNSSSSFEINRQHFHTVLAIFWINLRCLSYYLAALDNKQENNLISTISYCLYLPVMYFGPLIQYKDFIDCQKTCSSTIETRFKMLLKDVARFAFWFIVTEVSLHYIYASALTFQPEMVENFGPWKLYGFGYVMGQFFHLKYVVMYGISTSLAKFENITVPDTPKCIGRIHLYSDMWKYFDPGLYKFLIRYIYVPVLKLSSKYTVLKIHASFMCFAFVYIWHGQQLVILIWALLNFMGVTMEGLFNNLYKQYWKDKYDQYVNPVWKRRIGCMLTAPLLALSAVSNFYFFAGISIGNIFFKHLFTGDLQTTTLLLFCLYCCSQVSVQIKSLEEKKKGNQ